VAAGIVADDKAKDLGLHALRHLCASWWSNRNADGGLERPLKDLQHRPGHASIKMTRDVYGHLFPQADATAEMEAVERAFLGTTECQHAGELTRYFNGV
jgi:integrase